MIDGKSREIKSIIQEWINSEFREKYWNCLSGGENIKYERKMFNIWDGKAIKIWENENIAIEEVPEPRFNNHGQSCPLARIKLGLSWLSQDDSWRVLEVKIMGNQQVKEPKPNLSTLGAVSSIRSSRKPRVPKDSRILGSNNIFTEHHGKFCSQPSKHSILKWNSGDDGKHRKWEFYARQMWSFLVHWVTEF